jgi:DNA polymerase-1
MMKQFFLLDGSGYVFRAYYALPPLHDEDGHNVNAIFGFFRMLFKLWQQKPEHFVVTWDSPKKTIRKELYEDYKANRISMPDEFKYQMGMIKELVAQLKIPAVEIS